MTKLTTLNHIVNYIIAYGTAKTLSGNYHFSINEIENLFEVKHGYIVKNLDTLDRMLRFSPQVAGVDIYPQDDDIDIMFWLPFCAVEDDC